MIRWKFTYPQVWNYPLSTRSSFFFPTPSSPQFHSSAFVRVLHGCVSNVIVTDKIHGFGSPLLPVSSWEWGGKKNWRVWRTGDAGGGPDNLFLVFRSTNPPTFHRPCTCFAVHIPEQTASFRVTRNMWANYASRTFNRIDALPPLDNILGTNEKMDGRMIRILFVWILIHKWSEKYTVEPYKDFLDIYFLIDRIVCKVKKVWKDVLLSFFVFSYFLVYGGIELNEFPNYKKNDTSNVKYWTMNYEWKFTNICHIIRLKKCHI